jgi:hypothetical protein
MTNRPAELRIEGYTLEEILKLPSEEVDAFLSCGGPIVFQAGSATILGQVRAESGVLVVEIAHVDGGGEGVLLALWTLARAHARRRNLERVEWIVHATRCANPNPVLQRVLERKGFMIRELPKIGRVFFLAVDSSTADREG